MKKVLALMLVLALSLGMLSACGKKAETQATNDTNATQAPAKEETKATEAPTEAAPEPVTIKVSFWDATTTDRMTNLINAFQKEYPHITVDLIDVPAADYNTKLGLMLDGGSELDAFFIKDASETPALVEKGQLADLTSYVTRDNLDLGMFSGVADSLKIDGKLVGLPFSSSYYILFYNKDIFDAAGVAYPDNDTTWAEFEELTTKLTSGTGADKKYGALFHTWNACVQNWAVADGSMTILSEDLSGFKPYYEMVLRMQEAGTTIDYGTLKTSNLHYSSLFMQGNIAMCPMGGWYISTLLDKKASGETNVNWGIATLPHAEGVAAGNTVGSITPVAINEASDKKDAAWEFVKFSTSKVGAEINAADGQFPGYLSPETLAQIANKEGMPEGALEALQVKNVYMDRPIAARSAAVNQILGEEHGLILLGEKTVDEGIADMQKRSAEVE